MYSYYFNILSTGAIWQPSVIVPVGLVLLVSHLQRQICKLSSFGGDLYDSYNHYTNGNTIVDC